MSFLRDVRSFHNQSLYKGILEVAPIKDTWAKAISYLPRDDFQHEKVIFDDLFW